MVGWISEFIYRVRTVELSVEGDESIPDSVSLDVSMQLEPDMRVPITSKASLGEGAVGMLIYIDCLCLY
ncbi:hypothetical protein EON65_18090 [archaeon]|nr:MAG: hypothetical protein EON65_18090 [archaeon]